MADIAFWIVQGPGWLLALYLAIAQMPSAFRYEIGVRMGTQEPAERITPVGVALFWGFALADLVVYVPLLVAGLIGHATAAGWAGLVLGAALGITLYWPIQCLATVYKARGAPGWQLPKERDYWIVLPIIAGWAALALGLLLLIG
ncbi:MAG: hypothetical protein QNJ09_12660 [Paracoccaceae bacterium]|nr:hypothetical protein [Paracoccaceae bacterium]